MKISILVIYCFISTMHYSVECGLVKDFFGKVKETAQVVHKDIHEIWRPDKGNADNNTEQVENIPVAGDNDKHDNNKKEDSENEVTKASEITTAVSNTVIKDKKVEKDNQQDIKATTTKNDVNEEKHEETTTVATSTTTEKDGRANFSGACQTNYMRTADGRCRPVA